MNHIALNQSSQKEMLLTQIQKNLWLPTLPLYPTPQISWSLRPTDRSNSPSNDLYFQIISTAPLSPTMIFPLRFKVSRPNLPPSLPPAPSPLCRPLFPSCSFTTGLSLSHNSLEGRLMLQVCIIHRTRNPPPTPPPSPARQMKQNVLRRKSGCRYNLYDV